MNILVTGASGLLGRAVLRAAKGTALPGALSSGGAPEWIGLARSRAVPPLVRADITDPVALETLFREHAPDLVLHLAAERRPDMVDADPAKAERLNVESTDRLASLCAASGARLVYISTDYVFDGTRPPYAPNAPVNPLNAYGSMKLRGERAVAGGLGNRAAILRIPLLYGPVESLAECTVTEIAAALSGAGGLPRSFEHWAIRHPVHVDDVAGGILLVAARLAENRPPEAAEVAGRGPTPVYQISGRENLTKYDMARIMASVLGIPDSAVVPDPSPPKDCGMDTGAIEALGWRQKRGFAESVAGIIAPHAHVTGRRSPESTETTGATKTQAAPGAEPARAHAAFAASGKPKPGAEPGDRA